jgi:hypothetical protein
VKRLRLSWTIASALCLIGAAFFLLRENYDAAFVAATLGAVSWFLNYKSQIRPVNTEETETPRDDDDEAEDYEDEEDEKQ